MSQKRKNRKVFVIGDTHFPFHCKKAYAKMLKVIRKEKPDVVIQIGDLLDWYCASKYPKSLNVGTPLEEIKLGVKLATKMWEDIKKIVPRAECHQLLGNHDARMPKRIMEKLPELESFFNLKRYYQFKNVNVKTSDKEYIVIDGVAYVHGWMSKSLDHAKYFNMPVVHGHRHRPTVEYDRKNLWSMDVGYMADSKSEVMGYTQSKFTKWAKACGIVEGGKNPRIIILED